MVAICPSSIGSGFLRLLSPKSGVDSQRGWMDSKQSCPTAGNLRCAPYLVQNPNADIVEVAFHEVEKITNMDTHSCVRTSDEALERWVAKQLLIEESETGNPVPDGLTVLAYLIDHPQHAAQWGRHMTRKGSLQSAFTFYLSVYIYDAGFLVPLYGLGASREDVIMSMVQAERRLADFTTEDVNFDITSTLRLSIDSLRGGGGTITVPIEYAEAYIYTDLNKVEMVPAGQRDGQGAITFADAPTGKHHRRAATPRGDNRSASMRPDQKGKGDTRKGNAPAGFWSKGEGFKGGPNAGKGHKADQFKGHRGDQQKGKQYGRGRSARSRTLTGNYQPDARGSGYMGAQAAPFPYPSPMYPTFPMGGFMQQPMAGMMPQMWAGAMPQGWSQFPPENPGVLIHHTPQLGVMMMSWLKPSLLIPQPGIGTLGREGGDTAGRGK